MRAVTDPRAPCEHVHACALVAAPSRRCSAATTGSRRRSKSPQARGAKPFCCWAVVPRHRRQARALAAARRLGNEVSDRLHCAFPPRARRVALEQATPGRACWQSPRAPGPGTLGGPLAGRARPAPAGGLNRSKGQYVSLRVSVCRPQDGPGPPAGPGRIPGRRFALSTRRDILAISGASRRARGVTF